MIGASGAISAVLGAYLVLFPRARIQSLVFLGFFYQLVAVPSVIVLGFWFMLQLVDGIAALGATTTLAGGVAVWAHIGGFAAGALLALPRMSRAVRPAANRPAAAPGQRWPDRPAGPRTSRPRPYRPPPPWDNPGMADEPVRDIEMIVESVRVHMRTGRHVLLLKEIGAGRILPVWIGQWEAQAIAMRLQGIAAERPLTHDLFAATLEELRRAPGAGRHHVARRRDVPRPPRAGDGRQPPRGGRAAVRRRRARGAGGVPDLRVVASPRPGGGAARRRRERGGGRRGGDRRLAMRGGPAWPPDRWRQRESRSTPPSSTSSGSS